MRRSHARVFGAAALVLGAACASEPTGVRVHVHLGSIAYDELRFGVVAPGVNGGATVTLVDPDTAGRKTGPFHGVDQDVVILLRDDVSGREIFCGVEALRQGAPAGSGAGAVLAQAHHIRDVDIFVEGAAPPDGGAPGDGPAGDGAGGVAGAGGGGDGGGDGGNLDGGADARADARGGGGAAGTGAGGARGGTGGAPPGTGVTGTPCTRDATCATLHCVDGVCCESACDTACSTCNRNGGQAGQCRLVMNGMPDPRAVCVDTGAASCGTNGRCDAQGQCLRYPFGTACAPPCADPQNRFTAGICSVTSTCVGLGARAACPPPARSCVAGACL